MEEEQLKAAAAQLRKPEGEAGTQIGLMMNKGNAPMNLHTLAVVNSQPDDRILEIGMGNGFFVPNILKMAESIQYIGCDYAELMVQESIANNKDYVATGRAQFFHANADELPFDDNSFTKAFTINTLYFWEAPAKVLAELKRVLKPGGTLVIAIRPKHNLEQFPVTEYGFAKYTDEEILRMLEDSGFHSPAVTAIKEPQEEFLGKMMNKECLIISVMA